MAYNQSPSNSIKVPEVVHPAYLEVLDSEFYPTRANNTLIVANIPDRREENNQPTATRIANEISFFARRNRIVSTTAAFLVAIICGLLFSRVEILAGTVVKLQADQEDLVGSLAEKAPAKSAPEYVRAMKMKVPVRQLPDETAPQLGIISGGTVVTMLRKRDNWFSIITPGGALGWVRGEQVDVVEGR